MWVLKINLKYMKVEIIKSEVKKASQQKDDLFEYKGVIEPQISFSSLLDVYKKSFVAAWITDKISTSIQTWITCNFAILKEKVDKIDLWFLVKNLVVTGNAFFEIIRNGKWEIIEVLPMLTESVRKNKSWWYIQTSGLQKVYFNEFSEISKRWENYNPENNEIFHFKIESLRNKNYWDSLFEGVIEQLALISYIDTYYASYFENQAIRPNVFTDPEGKLSNKDKEVISEFFKSKMKGIDKAFSTAIIPTNLQKLDLWDEINTESFIKYRQELIKSVCIKLNIPADLLISDNSNRASSQVAKEIFNRHTVKPLQKKLLADLKKLFSDIEWVESLNFKELDTKDQKEEAEIYKIYVESGIMSIDEARTALGIEKRAK